MLSFDKIKSMSVRERNKLRTDDLINLIMATELESPNEKLNSCIEALNATLLNIRTELRSNSDKIVQLTVNNNLLSGMIKTNQAELLDLKSQIDRTEQYLRVNNVEIAGLELSTKERTDESIALSFFNDLLEVPVVSDDIDICHVIPSKRRDKKNVMVCKFLSRKTKLKVLSAKSKLRVYNGDNEDNTILLYEHLSPLNRILYAKASKVKLDLKFKFLWMKNGFPFLRQDDNSRVFKITSFEDLESVTG